MDGFPSGQRGRLVNLLAPPSRGSATPSHINADVAPIGRQLICNQQVIGSSPIIGVDFKI